jgi:hypothetical protein
MLKNYKSSSARYAVNAEGMVPVTSDLAVYVCVGTAGVNIPSHSIRNGI